MMTDRLVDRLEQDELFVTLMQTLESAGIDLDDEAAFSEAFEGAVEAGVPGATAVLKTELEKRAEAVLCDWASIQRGFEDRLRRRWAGPFDELRRVVVGCYELGKDFCEEEQEFVDDSDYTFDAVRRIHARACQAAWEVVCLIESGYANGALTRWRTIHELCVVALFLLEHGPDVAERYLSHDRVESLRASRQLRKHAAVLGMEPPSEEDHQELVEIVDSLVARFGPAFRSPYGWAADVLDNKSPHFSHIEESVALDHLRPFVKLACHGVHAGPKGLYFNASLGGGAPEELLLAGPSNTGFTDAAQLTARSLAVLTGGLLGLRPTISRLVQVRAVTDLADEIGETFFAVQQEVESLGFPEAGRLAEYRQRVIHWLRVTKCRVRRWLLGY